MSTDDEKKKRGVIGTAFEEWSRPLGYVALLGLTAAHVFKGVEVHDFAWYTASLLVAGEHLLELTERVAEKVIKAINLTRK